MFRFFRRYERYFFMVITFVIVISFSFFGTFSSLGSNSWREQVAFQAVNGKDITRVDLENMVIFLSTDQEDQRLFGSALGANFLNDGVIKKNFLETGLASELVKVYQIELQNDLNSRLQKEKKYALYTHPKARFLNVANAWNYLLPEMHQQYTALRSETDATSPSAFNARVQLYLAEKQFPPTLLKQVLRYQEKQQSWVEPDPALEQTDLSLFGYHTLPDWFGTRFVHLVSQFIINAAIMAESKGYQVSRSEVMADFIRQTDESFQRNKNNPSLRVKTPAEYFNEQLRVMGMDKNAALKVWEQVMLFRRYFHDVGSAVLTDALPFSQFNDYANKAVVADVYRLPPALRFGDVNLLQNLDIYLSSVTKRPKGDLLALPTDYKSIAEIEKIYPELIQKKVKLEMAQASKKALQSRVGIKEMWNWEISDEHWSDLKTKFPQLGAKNAKTNEERLAALEDLDIATRAKVDAVAKAAIVDGHPEWLQDALNHAPSQVLAIGLRSSGGKLSIAGLDDKAKRKQFIKLVDDAPLNELSEQLSAFSADGETYYRIKVVERAPEKEILTFAEANKDGTLDKMRDQLLEQYYVSNRDKNPTLFQKEDKSWKKYKDVKDLVATNYSEKLFEAIKKQPGLPQLNGEKKALGQDQLASLRFYGYVQGIKETLSKDPSQLEKWTVASGQTRNLADQWLLEKTEKRIDQNGRDLTIDKEEAFNLPLQQWSKVQTPSSGDLTFLQVKAEALPIDQEKEVIEKTLVAQAILSADAQQSLMKELLTKIVQKNAITLTYLKSGDREE